ncbi:MAG TPA: Uma2 family endonuclease [Kofleriaceae bacterium]|jgi:Uma2 family endonuclease|nr:Uma2 family endonuclease [Kofleriaceae bacterium]
MEAILRLPCRANYADYLAVEQDSAHRHEFIDGVIVAMAGGSDEHNVIAGRLARLLGNRETGSCRYYTPDQRFWIASRARGRYTDGSIICGAPDHPAHDAQATTNPTVVLEVLSPSSQGDDDGDKRSDFQSLASLEAYVLVAQDQRCVKVYRRAGSEWRATTYRDGDSFELPTLSTAIPVGDVYEGILDSTGRSLLR